MLVQTTLHPFLVSKHDLAPVTMKQPHFILNHEQKQCLYRQPSCCPLPGRGGVDVWVRVVACLRQVLAVTHSRHNASVDATSPPPLPWCIITYPTCNYTMVQPCNSLFFSFHSWTLAQLLKTATLYIKP